MSACREADGFVSRKQGIFYQLFQQREQAVPRGSQHRVPALPRTKGDAVASLQAVPAAEEAQPFANLAPSPSEQRSQAVDVYAERDGRAVRALPRVFGGFPRPHTGDASSLRGDDRGQAVRHVHVRPLRAQARGCCKAACAGCREAAREGCREAARAWRGGRRARREGRSRPAGGGLRQLAGAPAGAPDVRRAGLQVLCTRSGAGLRVISGTAEPR